MTETIFAHELAAVCRYQGHDEDRFGIPDGTLVVVTPADYDDEKVTVHATLPDLADPQCSAYLTDIGPTVADIEIVARDAPPWGMTVAPDADVAAVDGRHPLGRRPHRPALHVADLPLSATHPASLP